MIVEECVHSVLVVSSAENFREQLSISMKDGVYSPLDNATSVNEAQRKFAERPYDIVLINAPLKDDFGARFAMDVSTSSESVVALFVRSDMYDAVYEKVYGVGVFVIRKPSSPSVISQAFDWLRATRDRLKRLSKKSVSLQEKMEEIKVVNRAKLVLIAKLGMNEEDAHRFIEKQAMDACISKKTVAENIIKGLL